MLVLGEALLIGVLAGSGQRGRARTSSSTTWIGGIKFPIAFFPAFFIPLDAFWWGLAHRRGHGAGRQHHAGLVGADRESVRSVCESGLTLRTSKR